jgi:hypothetical protein
VIAVVVPWQPGCVQREAAWTLVRQRYEALGWPIFVGCCEGEWSKGRAVADALAYTDADVLVIADADCLPPEALPEAVEAAVGGQPWCVPHTRLVRLSKTATAEMLAGGNRAAGRSLASFPGGGVVVVRREAYESSGGFDPRMTRGEDGQLAVVLRALFGDCLRFDGQLVHLWHPPRYAIGDLGPSRDLMRRWRAAAKNPDDLSEMIQQELMT